MNKRNYITNARCPKCKEQLLLSPVEDYVFYCEHCEEDFYSIEICQVLGGCFNILIDMNINEFKDTHESIKKKFEDSCCIKYNDMFNMNVCVIGFREIPNNKRVKDIIKYFNLIEK